MKTLRVFIYNTIIGGVFFLLPLFVLLYVGQQIWVFFQDLGANMAEWMGFSTLAGVATKSVLAAFMILLVCFLFGLLARWSFAGWFRDWIESGIRSICWSGNSLRLC